TNIRQIEADIPARFIFKIDSKNSLELLPKIIKYIDGVLLSRSELSIDVNIHDIPIIQKNLIKFCNDHSKLVIVASELMNSMRINPNPTRAEVSDMANAVADGADALFLSNEVTEGPHAELVASFSYETLMKTEKWLEEKYHKTSFHLKTEDDAIIYGALRIAEEAKVKAIVCFTEGGYTAMRLSATRSPTNIIAVTYNKKIMRQLNLLRSVKSLVINSSIEVEKILASIKETLSTQLNFKKGEKFIFISLTASSISARNSNLFSIQEIE
ncbi:MAG: hypothetical protein K2X39_09905, partial [Silvanigrellaceae bacterium]|nr:hypothetical protein [Silvanigrellaceae bacterium]